MEILQEEKNQIKKLKNKEGEARGAIFWTDNDYIKAIAGSEGIKKLEEATALLGWPIDYKNIKEGAWYPVGLRMLSLLACKKAFGWGDKEIFMMGKTAPKLSFLIRTFVKYVYSLSGLIERATSLWGRHYTAGKLSVAKFDEEQKICILRLENFNIHPIFTHTYLRGYLWGLGSLAEKITDVQEQDCKTKDGLYYSKYIIRWEKYE